MFVFWGDKSKIIYIYKEVGCFMKRVVFIILSIFTLIGFTACSSAEVKRLELELSDAREQIALLQNKLNDAPENSADEKGEEENAEIIQDLLRHKELIPFEGVLGGTPGFYKESIIICKNNNTNGYIFVVADDGHVSADMLVSFSKGTGDFITWNLIAYNFNSTGWTLHE